MNSGDVTHNNPTVVNNTVYWKPVKKVNLKCFHKEDEREKETLFEQIGKFLSWTGFSLHDACGNPIKPYAFSIYHFYLSNICAFEKLATACTHTQSWIPLEPRLPLRRRP